MKTSRARMKAAVPPAIRSAADRHAASRGAAAFLPQGGNRRFSAEHAALVAAQTPAQRRRDAEDLQRVVSMQFKATATDRAKWAFPWRPAK